MLFLHFYFCCSSLHRDPSSSPFWRKISEQVAQEKVPQGLRYLDRTEATLILQGGFCQLRLRLQPSRLATSPLSSDFCSKDRDG